MPRLPLCPRQLPRAADGTVTVLAGLVPIRPQWRRRQISSATIKKIIAHAQSRGAIKREKELEPFVPGRAASVKPRCIAEELDYERKLAVKRLIIATRLIEEMTDLMRCKREPIRNDAMVRSTSLSFRR